VPAKSSLVIVPTFDERATIADVVEKLFAAAGDRVDLLVVDDNSPDGTGEIVRRLAAEVENIHLIERPRKLGLGSAYIAGFKWALERGYESVVEMDADLSHNPGDASRLLDALADADLAIGSRYVPGGGVKNWNRFRRALSRGANLYAGAALRLPVHDSTAGFRAYRTATLNTVDLDSVRSEGYGFQIEMTRRVGQNGGRIVELPITFVERAAGRSKMSARIVAEAFFLVAQWGIQDRWRRFRD
jgi:glycosyltransferase involved in cell wall biosynthesis